MEIHELIDEWEREGAIDRTDIGESVAKNPQLHAAWWRHFCRERTALQDQKKELSQLRHAKHNFYAYGPTRETQLLGWAYPVVGKILKTEVERYVDNDPHVVAKAREVSLQQEKVDFCESTIKSLKDRGFACRTAIDWHKFTSGEG